MNTAFVSGHLNLSINEFEEHYIPLLEEALSKGHEFVVGDARGVDLMATDFLASRGAKITVYHMFVSPRHDRGLPTVGGFRSDDERDAAMTVASDYDIAWIRPGREGSGTHKNIQRRCKKI